MADPFYALARLGVTIRPLSTNPRPGHRGSTFEFTDWQDNIRAVVLSMEALRAVDRYGVSKRGEQYTGWRALTMGSHDNHEGLETRDDAIEWLRESGLTQSTTPALMVRDALKAAHPDRGGDVATFRKVTRAKELIEG